MMNSLNKYSFVSEVKDQRIDKVLLDYFEDIDSSFSRTAIQKLIKDGLIKINNKTTKSSYKLKIDDLVEITNIKKQIDLTPQDIKLRIVYEDQYLIVINKKADMVVHPAPGNYTNTLLNAVLFHTNNVISTIGAPLRPGVVHRLDKDTTGLIVIAKNDYTHLDLAKQFATKVSYRRYTAIVFNNPFKVLNTNTINTFFSRHPKDRKKFTSKVNTGKHATTIFKVIKNNNEISLLDVELKTGRTHQIRVHFFDNNCPLIGDKTYSTKLSNKYKINRQALHARVLSFIHPIFKNRLHFICPIENDIKEILKVF